MAAWPNGFPAPLSSQFGIQADQLFIRSDFEAGPARHRRRSTYPVDKLQVDWLLTRAQFGSFQAWWHSDIDSGAGWFDVSLDLGSGETDYEMRFVEPYRASQVNFEYWRVSANVEIRSASVSSATSDYQLIDASYFGIRPDIDSTDGFAAFASYLSSTSYASRKGLGLGPGTYYADKIELPGTANGSTNPGGFVIIGAGATRTKITANSSTEPCFFSNTGGPIRDVYMRGFQILGVGATNPGQMGMLLLGEPSTSGDMTGGFWNVIMEDVRVSGFALWQFVSKGGNYSISGHAPQQFISMRNFVGLRSAGIHWPVMSFIGQHGQCRFENTQADGASLTNNGGPAIYIHSSTARTAPQPSGINTTTDIWTTSTHFLRDCQPIRIVGTNLPTSTPQVALGTTYFAIVDVDSLAAHNTFKVASSASNAAAATAIDVTNQGTPANYQIVQQWTTAAPSGGEFTTEYPHLMSTGDEIQLVGASLPTSLSTGTTYYVIRTGHKTFKLASSYANARARTVASYSDDGTYSSWGIQTYPISGTPYQPYYLDFDLLTCQQQNTGVWCGDANMIQVKPYFEDLTNSFILWNVKPFYIGAGRLGNAATLGYLIWSQGANTKVFTDEDLQHRLGTTTNTYLELNGPSEILRRTGLGTAV